MWLRQAAFGRAVVPDVNWMLIMSSRWRGESGVTAWLVCEYRRSLKGVVDLKSETSRRPAELSTRMTLCRDGTDADSIDPEVRSGEICLSSDMFSRGGLKGRLVSVPIMRCVAERCDRAEITWGELNAGFSGTYVVSKRMFARPFFRCTYQNRPELKQSICCLATFSQHVHLDQLSISMSYHSELDIVSQADSHSHALLYTLCLQPCCDRATPMV